MARHSHTKGSTNSEGDAAAAAPDAVMVDVDDAFEGETAPRRINLANPAPFGYTTAATLGLVALVDRADSAMVGGVLPKLQDHFGFSDTMAGFLLSAPSVAALLLVVPAGRFADTRSRKALLSVVILAWGLLTFGAAAAPTFALFFLARVLLGVATPLNIPASASIVGDMYRSEARTKAFALVRVMEYLGFPLGVAVGGIVGGMFGWRAAFLVMGVPAVLLSAYIALRLKEPRRGMADDLAVQAEQAGLHVVQAEGDAHVGFEDVPEAGEPLNLAHADEDQLEKPGVWTRTKDVLSIKTLRWIIIGQAMLFAGVSGLFSFATLFFYRVHDMSDAAAAAIAGTLGLVGLLVGGLLASRVGDRHHGERQGWKIFISACSLTVAAFSVLVFAAVPNLPLQIALYLVINVTNIIALANLGAAQADVIPARMRGTGFATAQFLVTIGSSFGALILGSVSAYVIRGETDVTASQVKDAEELVEDLEKAKAPQAAIDAAQAAFDKLDDVFGPAQALGIRWGVASLFVLLLAGALTIFRARATYDADAAKVIAEASESAEPA